MVYRTPSTDIAPVDRYTVGHAAVGVLMGLGGFPWRAAILVSVGWEFLEHFLKDEVPHLFPGGGTQDTLVNSAMDSAAMLAGYAVMRPPQRSA